MQQLHRWPTPEADSATPAAGSRVVSARRCDVWSDEHHEVSHRMGAKCFQPDISQELALMFIYWPRESVVASDCVVLEVLMYRVQHSQLKFNNAES